MKNVNNIPVSAIAINAVNSKLQEDFSSNHFLKKTKINNGNIKLNRTTNVSMLSFIEY
jgi:hypothetical protein